jgi:hypothetical protein
MIVWGITGLFLEYVWAPKRYASERFWTYRYSRTIADVGFILVGVVLIIIGPAEWPW